MYPIVLLCINSSLIRKTLFRLILNYKFVKKSKKLVLYDYSILAKFAVLCRRKKIMFIV